MSGKVRKAKGALGKEGFYRLPDRVLGQEPVDEELVELLARLHERIKVLGHKSLSIYVEKGFVSVKNPYWDTESKLDATYVSPEKEDWDEWCIDPASVQEEEE